MESPEVALPQHTVVLGVADAMAAAHLRRQLMDHPRFDLVATAHNAVQTLYAVEETHASVVLMADDSPGLRGREVLADIAAASPETYVIITTPGDPAALANEPAVASAVYDTDIYGIYAALNQLAEFLDRPKAEIPERRAHADRRLHQDWTKVFAERREHVRRHDAVAAT
ncbi:MAG: hypothetical protein R2710_09605 [Acidimicrobiales bacterium]